MATLSLVIPCYNEAKSLQSLVVRCAEVFRNTHVEVVLVDNGSNDNTPEILASVLPEHTNIRSVRVNQNRGYGHGILAGLRNCPSRYLGWTHADMQTDPADLLQALELLPTSENGNHMFIKGQRIGRPLGDVAFTVAMSAFETALFARKFWDINAQPTVFPRTFFETWRKPPEDFSLDLYAYYMAHRSELCIKRFPVRFQKRAYGKSHWNVDWQSKMKFIKRTVDFSLALRRSGQIK